MSEALFLPAIWNGGEQSAFIAAMIASFACVFAVGVFVGRSGRDAKTYFADLAWLRAGVYFSVCLLLSWVTGVLPTLIEQPWLNAARVNDASWWSALGFLIVFQYVAYHRVWAAGTTALDRKLYPSAAIGFGVLWGLCEAQLFLSFWAIAESFGLPIWLVGVLTYFAVGGFYGPWHRYYWDYFVAPQHNIPEWNMKKVFFVHTPNMILTLLFLAWFNDPHSYAALMAFCLVGATWSMRFPSPLDQVSRRTIVDTYQ